ncbi:hypothetical protein XMG7_002408 [Aliiroseovarius sp. xm-g-7]|nr:hypothetical protein [Aliiroseovarius sp. xm-g-7]
MLPLLLCFNNKSLKVPNMASTMVAGQHPSMEKHDEEKPFALNIFK